MGLFICEIRAIIVGKTKRNLLRFLHQGSISTVLPGTTSAITVTIHMTKNKLTNKKHKTASSQQIQTKYITNPKCISDKAPSKLGTENHFLKVIKGTYKSL